MSDYEDVTPYSQPELPTEHTGDDTYSHLHETQRAPVDKVYDSPTGYAHLNDSAAWAPVNDYGGLPGGIAALPTRNGLPVGLRRETTHKAAPASDYEEIDLPRGRPESSPSATLDESRMNMSQLKRRNAVRRHEAEASPPPLPPRKGGSASSA